MRIGIYFNANQVELSSAESFRSELIGRGADAVIFMQEEEIAGVDRLVVLGGDGTVLRAARRAAEVGIPLVGVNYGHIGFLTEFGREEREAALDFVLSDSCERMDRAMLEVELNGRTTVCLNECSMLRAVAPEDDNKVIRIGVSIDGSDAGEITADGIIVATPTGSTAYSLSAGGSILSPECEAFILTPICAFSMKSRPIVYASSATLSFTVGEGHCLLLYGDGKFLGCVEDEVRVRRSERKASFLTRDKRGYLLRITEKINKI